MQVQEFAQVKIFPADLRQVIDHWKALPPEVKQWATLSADDPNYQKYLVEDERRKVFDLADPKYSRILDTTLTVEITAGEKAYSVDVGKKTKTELKAQQ